MFLIQRKRMKRLRTATTDKYRKTFKHNFSRGLTPEEIKQRQEANAPGWDEGLLAVSIWSLIGYFIYRVFWGS